MFALYWGPGQLYPLVIFVLIHMLVSAIMHIFFSEDTYYVRYIRQGEITEWKILICRKGKILKFLHNTIMNSFATIYFHNYLRMDEMPPIDRTLGKTPLQSDCFIYIEYSANDEIDAQSPGLHISTFIRQTAFDILYLIEFIILLGFGFSAQIVRGQTLYRER